MFKKFSVCIYLLLFFSLWISVTENYFQLAMSAAFTGSVHRLSEEVSLFLNKDADCGHLIFLTYRFQGS